MEVLMFNNYKFLSPKSIHYGLGSLEVYFNKTFNIGKKALIVTDRVMMEKGYVDKLLNILKQQNIKQYIFNEIDSEPTDIHVQKGIQSFNNYDCDFLIALGGGSPIDTAKAISVMINNPGNISDYMGIGKIIKKGSPLIAIPTTAGTGSEATQFTIITDTKNQVKMLIGSEYLVPDVAIDDSIFTISLPPQITAATGVDALTHAVEAYTSIKNQPVTDIFALSAIKRINQYLKRAWLNGDDKEARSEMMLAALEAGLAFSNSSVTIVHGMSRPVGALFHIPHGISNAVLLPACMEFAISGVPDRFAKVAETMGADISNLSPIAAARQAVFLIKKLCQEVEIPTITGLGIKKENFLDKLEKMASDAMKSGSPNNTFRKPTKEDIIDIYKRSL